MHVTDADRAMFPVMPWALTATDDAMLIVDCDKCGELGTVMAAYHSDAPDRDEYGRALALFRSHLSGESR